MLFLYTWFVKTSGSDSNEGKKKKSFLFLNKMFLCNKKKLFLTSFHQIVFLSLL